MKVIKVEDVEVKEIEGGDIFTGGKVYSQFLIGDQIAKEIHVGIVKFSAVARNLFHTHLGEQILIVTEGKGIVATEDKETVVTPGTIIYVPPEACHILHAAR